MLNKKEISNKNYWLSLEIKHSMTNNNGRLTILLHIEDKRLSKSKIKEDAINRLMKIYKIEYVNKNNRIGYQSAVIDFNDFPIRNRKGYVDYDKTKKYLYKLISIFNQRAIKTTHNK